jgi:hypothetical protein
MKKTLRVLVVFDTYTELIQKIVTTALNRHE